MQTAIPKRYWIGMSGVLLFWSTGCVGTPQRPVKTTTIVIEGKNQFGAYIIGDQPGAYFHWTQEKWSGNERPFTAIRQEIDSRVQEGTDVLTLLASYKQEAMKHPRDARAQFRRAYITFVAYNRLQPGQNNNNIIAGVREGLEMAQSPKTYEYARMRTIFTQWDAQWCTVARPYLIKCVKRLLLRNPQDFQIKYIFAADFAGYKNTNSMAVKWAHDYQKKYVANPQSYLLLGRVYEGRFGLFTSKRDADFAIVYLRKYLQLAPKNAIFRKATIEKIGFLQDRLRRYQKRGWVKP